LESQAVDCLVCTPLDLGTLFLELRLEHTYYGTAKQMFMLWVVLSLIKVPSTSMTNIVLADRVLSRAHQPLVSIESPALEMIVALLRWTLERTLVPREKL